MDPELIPVIAGIGEIRDRPNDPAQCRHPLELMSMALDRASEDARGLLSRIDSLDVVHQTTWRYSDTARRLCDAAKITPARAVYGVTGGESPVRYIHEAAMRIASGQSRVAAVTGGEAQHARARARKAGVDLPWPERASEIENKVDTGALYNPLAVAHQILAPADIYPLYEVSSAASWGQTPAQAQSESALLWQSLSAVAEHNPFSWSGKALDAEQIGTVRPDNRMVAWPYTKSMVANPQVNQGAAVIVASLAEARRAGIPDERLVFIRGGAFANEPRDYLARDRYDRSTAQDAVLRHTAELASSLDALELYSCFPVVPKMARRTLNLNEGVVPTVTGGLSFFGAPLNNYMTHAACAMVRAVREGAATGLLYGQGEFVTKHHALVVTRHPSPERIVHRSVQGEADSARACAPELAPDYSGPATLESFTMPFDRESRPRFAMVLALTLDGRRTVARIEADEVHALARLTAQDRSPVGATGSVRACAGALSRWCFD